MDRLDAMRLFTRIVELGSFSRAADNLKLPAATATHTIKQLEARLGVRLLQRTTRHVSATPDGQAYYQRCVRILADVDETEAGFGHSGAAPRGKLRVDLQGTLARHFVLPRLGEFFARYPELELEIGMGDRLVDMVREGVDCVLRGGVLRDSSMVARRVASLRQVTCASAAYLDQHGTPRTLDELAGHRAVNFYSIASGKVFPFDFVVDGEPRSVQLSGSVSVSNAEAYVQCCANHLGLIQLPRYHVAAQLAHGSFRAVLDDWRPPEMAVSAMYPQQRQLSPRVRVFVDWLAEVMAAAS
ncbi:LysR family transcriptional regulator [Pseudoduganella aquatica]|uniref:LysR family transcriptional regulator n=1 Tax=Pseudoduganella aquatica TaxID=2660641 RepID=A0A7X4HA48_9BURK|nr:LysR family transcriptional regulator [Pseudoduganella aquatica]MYN07410.1 LysR family transcriptional regulator [Pseudoduganella aquatica]